MAKLRCRFLTLTQANLDHGHIYLTECMDMFPEDALGGPNKSQAAQRTIRILYGTEVVDTDIDREKRIFRQRAWVREFFSENRMVAGDRVWLEQLEPYLYRVSSDKEVCCVCCLSIQQPWADLILDGKKRVENRSDKRRSRLWNGQDRGLLGIHASTGLATWDRKTPEERDDFAPGWRVGDSPVRKVLGVVDVIQICQPHELPEDLRENKFVEKSANWCYVFENPRKLVQPLEAKGNSALFYLCIPRRLLSETQGKSRESI